MDRAHSWSNTRHFELGFLGTGPRPLRRKPHLKEFCGGLRTSALNDGRGSSQGGGWLPAHHLGVEVWRGGREIQPGSDRAKASSGGWEHRPGGPCLRALKCERGLGGTGEGSGKPHTLRRELRGVHLLRPPYVHHGHSASQTEGVRGLDSSSAL